MSTLKKEAMGQYNYVAPIKENASRHKLSDFNRHTDVTIEIVDANNKVFKIKPPKMFETSYDTSYRHPPNENFSVQTKEKYTAYPQQVKTKQKNAERSPVKIKPAAVKEIQKYDEARTGLKSASYAIPKPFEVIKARAQSADVYERKTTPTARLTKADKINEEFARSIIKARTGPEWNRPKEVSYDVMNPEIPSNERKTHPYRSVMEEMQEKIAIPKEMKLRSSRSTPLLKKDDMKAITPISRSSTASNRSRSISQISMQSFSQNRPMTSSSSVSSLRDDYFLQTALAGNDMLESIQEEEIQEQLEPPSLHRRSVESATKEKTVLPMKKRRSRKVKNPSSVIDIFVKKGTDPRFYASKKNLRTPNEMERFKKARRNTFMKNVEQAIPEMDSKNHEVKFQPERQLYQDARWRIRQDLKDVRNKNNHSLVDRFEKRHQNVKDESIIRLGDQTYVGRMPVSIYKLQNGIDTSYPLHNNRRRVTPSLGSVQRARNLGSYAQIFNQSCAPPSWGPQKVNDSLYLPAAAIKL